MTYRNTVINLVKNRTALYWTASIFLIIAGVVISIGLGVGTVNGIGYKYGAVGCIITSIVVQYIALIDLLITGE